MTFSRRETAILLLGDLLVLMFSLWAALLLRNLAFPPLGYFVENFVPFLPIFFLSLGVFFIAGLYEKQTRPIRRIMGARIFGAQVANVLIAALVFFILPLSIAPKTILFLYLVVSLIAESVWRFYRIKREIAIGARTKALLIGTGTAVSELFEEINDNDRFLVKFSKHIDTASTSFETYGKTLQTSMEERPRIVVADMLDPVVIGNLSVLYGMTGDTASVIDFSSFYEQIFDRVPLAHTNPTILLETPPHQYGVYAAAKRVFDILLALFGLLLATPFVAIACILLYIEGGSAFITHERIGQGGRRFGILKLRTMLFNDHGDPELQKKNRVTSLGKFLRQSRVDEFPQLWNILRGDVSFIGPRPELPNIAAVYDDAIPYYNLRHLVAPGLSGWAQIHDYDAPRGGADVERTKKKLSFDLYYLKHRSFGLDLAIALKTIRALLSFSGV